jgi:predicted ATP-binding protein involved in virulence
VVLTVFSSNVKSIRKGVIKISNNKAKAPPTILLIGETGVGKSSVLQLIGNVLAGNNIDHYNFEILDHTNEQESSNNQSRTTSARFYELTSKNRKVVSTSDS